MKFDNITRITWNPGCSKPGSKKDRSKISEDISARRTVQVSDCKCLGRRFGQVHLAPRCHSVNNAKLGHPCCCCNCPPRTSTRSGKHAEGNHSSRRGWRVNEEKERSKESKIKSGVVWFVNFEILHRSLCRIEEKRIVGCCWQAIRW